MRERLWACAGLHVCFARVLQDDTCATVVEVEMEAAEGSDLMALLQLLSGWLGTPAQHKQWAPPPLPAGAAVSPWREGRA